MVVISMAREHIGEIKDFTKGISFRGRPGSSFDYHCFRSKVKFGEQASEIHYWIDYVGMQKKPNNRYERHYYDQELPKELIEKYGTERAYAHMILHLDDDFIPGVAEHGLGYEPPMDLVIETRMKHTLDYYLENMRTYKIIHIPIKACFYGKEEGLSFIYGFLSDFQLVVNQVGVLVPEKVPKTYEEMILYIKEYIEKCNYLSDLNEKEYSKTGGKYLLVSAVFRRSAEFAQLILEFLSRT